MTKLLSLVGLIATLAVVSGLDWVLNSLKDMTQRTFVFEPYFGLIGPLHLVSAGMLLMLAWFVLIRAERSRLVSSIFVFVGLAITLYLVVAFSLKIPLPIGRLAIFLAPGSHVSNAGAFIAVIGIAGFFRKSRHN